MNFLILVVVVLGIIALAQLIRVFELSAELRGETKEVVSQSDNRSNARLMLLFMIAFFVFVIWQCVKYSDRLLPEPASKHGVDLDQLMNFNLIIIFIVFFITNALLFYFAYKYYYREGRKATFFAHSNKLELIWTSVPAVVLAIIIVYGLTTWNRIMTPAAATAQKIELYAKQFDWTARYAGADNNLGKAAFRNITDNNVLGLDTTDKASFDDIIVKGEMHIPVNRPLQFYFRSRDVIHSAYMPHFRAQMNTVPGMVTQFNFTPTITTQEMRNKLGRPDFDYVLLCAKICGAAHYNMQMTIVVDTPEDYEKWISEQKAFKAPEASTTGSTEGKDGSPRPDKAMDKAADAVGRVGSSDTTGSAGTK